MSLKCVCTPMHRKSLSYSFVCVQFMILRNLSIKHLVGYFAVSYSEFRNLQKDLPFDRMFRFDLTTGIVRARGYGARGYVAMGL